MKYFHIIWVLLPLLMVSCRQTGTVNYDFNPALFEAEGSVRDWARTDYFASVRETVHARPGVIFFGDSVTEGWWENDPEFFAQRGWLCFGISGQTSSQLLVRFRSDILQTRPRKVVILCGTNDLAGNGGAVTPEVILGNIVSMCELALYNGITPLVCSVTPCDAFPWAPSMGNPSEKIIDFNRVLKEFADSRGIEYVDYYSLLSTPEGAMISDYTSDHCHPNRKAYALMEAEVQRHL